MITDKFKGYNSKGVKVTLYTRAADSYSMAAITNPMLGGSALVEPVGSGSSARFRLTISKFMQVLDTSYWTKGDSAIQVAIDSMTQ